MVEVPLSCSVFQILHNGVKKQDSILASSEKSSNLG